MSGLDRRGPPKIELRRPGAAGALRAALPPVKPRARLPAFEPAPDPLSRGEPAADPEIGVAQELDEIQAGFRDRMKAEAERAAAATDGSYYFVACFESGEQVTAFLRALGLDSGGDLFIDGRAMADRLKIDLPASALRFNPGRKPDPAFARLVRKPK